MRSSSLKEYQVLRHALATPLTSILLCAETALQQLPPTENTDQFSTLYRIVASSYYAQTILKLADQDVTCPKTHVCFELVPLIEELGWIIPQSKQRSLLLNYDPDLKVVLTGNRYLLLEVLICLVNNAFESYCSAATRAVVSITIKLNQQRVKIMVTDGGKGMTPLQLWLLKFHQRSSKPNHSGIGFRFVKQTIVSHFKGQLSIQSQKQLGTTITCALPYLSLGSDTYTQNLGQS